MWGYLRGAWREEREGEGEGARRAAVPVQRWGVARPAPCAWPSPGRVAASGRLPDPPMVSPGDSENIMVED